MNGDAKDGAAYCSVPEQVHNTSSVPVVSVEGLVLEGGSVQTSRKVSRVRNSMMQKSVTTTQPIRKDLKSFAEQRRR